MYQDVPDTSTSIWGMLTLIIPLQAVGGLNTQTVTGALY